jgi:NAD(P)-dependent dehydrogenase (short-subunit alcohol dehydrogenase family)
MSSPAFVVGVGPGLGSALARRLARGGAPVAVFARSAAQLDLPSLGASVRAFSADAADPRALRAALEAAIAALGPPAVAIYNPSVLRMAGPLEVGAEALIDELRLHVGGAVTMAEVVVPAMRARGGGQVLVTGGGTALRPWADATALSVGKAAARSYALALADALAGGPVRAATITVDGQIVPGTDFDPDLIADAFARVLALDDARWQAEHVWRGPGSILA